MKKFERNKTVEEISRYCAERGFLIGHSECDKGSDFVTINGVFDDKFMQFVWNTFNGRFIVKYDGSYINESSSEFDGVKWYNEVLDLIYVKKAA